MANTTAPAFSQDVPLHGSTPKQFLVIAVGIAQELGWQIDYLSDSGIIAFTNPSFTDRNIKVTIQIERFIAEISAELTSEKSSDWTAASKAIEAFTSYLHNPNYTYSSEELVERYEALKPHLVPPEEDPLAKGSSSFEESKAEFFSVFIPRRGYFITPLLILINIAIYAFSIGAAYLSGVPYPEWIAQWGANYRAATLNGQWWRLLTCTFLHWDLLHLFMNVVALYIIGFYLEPYLNKAKFTFAYLLTGIVSSLASLYWHENAVSAGASGAVFGLYGVFLALLITSIIEPGERGRLLPSMIVFIGYNLTGGVNSNTDHAAHIGGLIGGLVIGYCLYPALQKQQRLGQPL